MRYGLLGPLEVRGDDGGVLELRGAQPRLVLAVLLAAEGRVVPVDTLVHALWGEAPPASATGTLHTHVSRLRRVLEPDRGPRDPARVLLSEPPGYRLAVEADAVDFRRFERLADEGRAALEAGRYEEAVSALALAEALWRGPALAQHLDIEVMRGLATRLEERRRVVLEQRLEAELALGRDGPVAVAAAEAVRAEPLRERRWELLALALYRSGRQAEALRALDEVRRTLVEELGVEPGRALKDLGAAILTQDPALELPATAAQPLGFAPVVPAAPDLVGREDELGALRASLDEVLSGARFAVVTGEPGIGKTTLLEALAAEARARGVRVAWGRAYEGGEAPAFWPWLEVLRAVVAAPGADGVDQLLAPAAGVPAGPAAGSFRVFEAVAAALGSVAAAVPLVVLLDDLQWADPDSLSLLTFLAGRLRDEHVLLIGTAREGEAIGDELVDLFAAVARRPSSRRLSLRGLSDDELTELLRARVGRDLPAPVAAAISERAEGNPFFARELARLVEDDGAAPTAVPATVGDVVRQRVRRLPEPTVKLLGVAAVLGREVELDVLAAAADRPLDVVLEGIEPAFAAGLLVEGRPGAPVRFAHALVREALVDQLSGVRRTRLHLRAADAVLARHGDRDEVAEVVADHLWAAAPLGVSARAAEALERAGLVAFRRAALASAGRSFERAVSLHLANGAQESELRALVRLLDVRRLLGDYAGVARAYERATERARQLGQDAVLVELLWAEWGVHSIMGAYARSRELAAELVSVASASDDPVLRFAGHTMAGMQAWDEGRIAAMRGQLEAADALTGSLPAGADRTSVLGYQLLLQRTFLAHALGLTGDLEAALARFEALTEPDADAYQRITGSVFWGTTLLALGQLDALEPVARTGVEADPEGLYVLWNANLRLQHGIALLHGGDVEAGRASFDAGRATYTRLGLHAGITAFLASAGLALLGAGMADDAERLVAEARAEFDARGQGWTEPILLLAEAELAAAPGRDDVAAGFARAEAVAREQGASAVAERIAGRASAGEAQRRPAR